MLDKLPFSLLSYLLSMDEDDSLRVAHKARALSKSLRFVAESAVLRGVVVRCPHVGHEVPRHLLQRILHLLPAEAESLFPCTGPSHGYPLAHAVQTCVQSVGLDTLSDRVCKVGKRKRPTNAPMDEVQTRIRSRLSHLGKRAIKIAPNGLGEWAWSVRNRLQIDASPFSPQFAYHPYMSTHPQLRAAA